MRVSVIRCWFPRCCDGMRLKPGYASMEKYEGKGNTHYLYGDDVPGKDRPEAV